MKNQTLLLLSSLLLCLLSLVMCGDDDDDDSNDDNQLGEDYIEGPDCTGYNYPDCGTDVDVPPQLLSVTILVNDLERPQPVTVSPTDSLSFALEFNYPGHPNQICGGHIFIIKDGQTLCMDNDGLPADDPYPQGIPGICSTEENGEPFLFDFDPSNFLNGEGAPYFLEISNDCATRSNRLSLDIVTLEE